MNELKLTLPGSIRSKKNSKRVFKRGKFATVLPSKAYEAWEKEARASIYLGTCAGPAVVVSCVC